MDELDEAEVHLLEVRMDRDVDGDKWWEHEPLRWLDLSSNCITEISPKIRNLVMLTVLNVSKLFWFVFKTSLFSIMCLPCCMQIVLNI
jgi:hypothetical protein